MKTETDRINLQEVQVEIISNMLDNPNELGIYPTTQCFDELEELGNKYAQQQACDFIEFTCDYTPTKDVCTGILYWSDGDDEYTTAELYQQWKESLNK